MVKELRYINCSIRVARDHNGQLLSDVSDHQMSIDIPLELGLGTRKETAKRLRIVSARNCVP